MVKPEGWDKAMYIIHSFDKYEETQILQLTVLQVMGKISLLIFVIMLSAAIFIYRTFNHSIDDLYHWVTQNRKIETQPQNIKKYNAKGKAFIEIQSIADQLNHYVDVIEENKHKERDFIRKLSHELRTPLAITQAALDILDNDKSIPDNIVKKISSIRSANNDMIQTASAILGLWQNSNDESNIESIHLKKLFLKTIKDHQSINERNELSFDFDIDEEVKIQASIKIFKILINNLISNVFHHSSSGNIVVSFNDGSLKIQNPVDGGHEDKHNWLTKNHGIGLSVIKTICENYGWGINIKSHVDSFIP